VQFSIANLLIITGFVNIAKGHWDTISKCLLLVWPQADKFSLHGISKKRSGLTGLSSSDEEFSYVVKMVTQKITLFPSLLKWNSNVPAILSHTHTHKITRSQFLIHVIVQKQKEWIRSRFNCKAVFFFELGSWISESWVKGLYIVFVCLGTSLLNWTLLFFHEGKQQMMADLLW
jgi:hypothetical protein